MNRFLRSLALLPALLPGAAAVFAQAPTDNPYQVRYPAARHWTADIRWDRVVNAREVDSLLGARNAVDSARLHQTLQALSGEGGGVLYFPAGTYLLDYDVRLPGGVVVRGATPRGEADALSDRYQPPTKFEFPAYKSKPDGKTGTPNATAFKGIYAAAARQQNLGLVNLDINRAVIDFSAGPMASGAPKRAKAGGHRNVLLFGLRQNNAARPDPLIPTATQVSRSRGWQRWPLKDGAHIRLDRLRNGVVANCRLNDAPTDNYRQNAYLLDDGMILDGSQAYFNYTDHTGIAAQGDHVEITGTFVRVAPGNEAVSVPARKAVLTGNRLEVAGPANWVREGREAVRKDYDLLYRADSLHEFHTYTHRNDTLKYCLIKPRNFDPAKKYPLILFFHPIVEPGSAPKQPMRDLAWYLATEQFRRDFPALVLMPLLPARASWVPQSRIRSISQPIHFSMNIVAQLENSGMVDASRIYVIGLEWGGAAAWDVLTRYPEKVAAAVPVSAFYEITPDRAETIREIPIWVVGGDSDEVISPTLSQIMLTSLQKGNINFKHSKLENTGHRCWYRLTETPDLFTWLFAQHK
jgi:dienelactone hydrolase